MVVGRCATSKRTEPAIGADPSPVRKPETLCEDGAPREEPADGVQSSAPEPLMVEICRYSVAPQAITCALPRTREWDLAICGTG